jgi:hypothetical protein
LNNFLALYCAVARQIMSPYLAPNSCIAASRITIDCLHLLGIPAEPLPTKFVVYVKEIETAYTCGVKAEEIRPTQQSRKQWQSGWNGHLIVRSDKWLIDPSFDQVDIALGRRLKVSEIPVFPLPVTTEGFNFHASYTGKFGSDLIAEIDYVSIQDDSWRTSEAWNDEGLDILTALITSTMRRLAHKS